MKYRVSYIDIAGRAHISLCDSVKEAAIRAGRALGGTGTEPSRAMVKIALLSRWMTDTEYGKPLMPDTLELGDITIACVTEQEAAQWQRAF